VQECLVALREFPCLSVPRLFVIVSLRCLLVSLQSLIVTIQSLLAMKLLVISHLLLLSSLLLVLMNLRLCLVLSRPVHVAYVASQSLPGAFELTCCLFAQQVASR